MVNGIAINVPRRRVSGVRELPPQCGCDGAPADTTGDRSPAVHHEDRAAIEMPLSDRNGVVPADFYSTTNLQTHVRVEGRWVEVERQRMDAVVVVHESRAVCRKLRDVKAGDGVICGTEGIPSHPSFATGTAPTSGS